MRSFRDLLEVVGEKYPPRMRYGGGESAEEFAAWRAAFRAKLVELRGEPLPRTVPPKVETVERVELADHVREKVRIESVLGSQVPAYVLLPRGGGDGPRAGVLALHGHLAAGKEAIAGVVNSQRGYGLAAVRAGFVTLCPDWWGWGERAEVELQDATRDMCNVKYMAAAMYGVSLLSIMISDGQAALDALLARPEVDARSVGVMGNSFGGRMAMWLAVFDERVRAAVCSGCLNCFRERSLVLSSCGAQFLAGLLAYGDVQEVFAAIAPRPLMIMSGAADALLPPEYVRQMRPVIERAYRLAGAAAKLEFHDHPGGHTLLAEPALAWLARHLGA